MQSDDNSTAKQKLKPSDIKVGDRFGVWSVIKDLGSDSKNRWFDLRCECGETQKIMFGNFSRAGYGKACKHKPKYEIGQRFGSLVVVGESYIRRNEKNTNGIRYIPTRCDCDEDYEADSWRLLSGKITRCRRCASIAGGFTSATAKAKVNRENGLIPKRFKPGYKNHFCMKQRCFNPKSANYDKYGGCGVTVCQGWLEFNDFFADMGEKPSKKHTIDRIDGSKNYSCGHCDQCLKEGWTMNCRWATPREQSNNTSFNRHITYDGETKTTAQWSRSTGINRATIEARLRHGWSVEKTLTQAPQERDYENPKRYRRKSNQAA